MTGESDLHRTARLLLHVVTRLNRWAEAHAGQGQEGNLSLRQFSALTLIEEEALGLGELARQLHVTPAVVTGLIDRLERRGYVHRTTGTDDRRRVLLSLTDEGRRARNALELTLIDGLTRRLSAFTPDDLRTLERILGQLATMPFIAEPSTGASRSD